MFNEINGFLVEEYIRLYDEQKYKKHREFLSRVNSLKNLNELVLKLNKDFDILLFSEDYCPDCLVLFPFVEFLCIKLGVNVKILKRQGNEEFLRELTGEAKIPTAIFINADNSLRGMIVEFPENFKKTLIGLTEDEMKRKIAEYREGKYFEMIEKEVISILNNY
ncbi:MAG: thioredoxin family protein [Caloramator sp.]|nr:thioredoxin family protein [Caloramator sp.]